MIMILHTPDPAHWRRPLPVETRHVGLIVPRDYLKQQKPVDRKQCP